MKLFDRALPVAAFLVVATGASLLASCGFTEYGDAFRAAVREKGAQASDATVDNLTWGLCNAITIGSVRRKFMGTTKWPAYLTICGISEKDVTPFANIRIPDELRTSRAVPTATGRPVSLVRRGRHPAP